MGLVETLGAEQAGQGYTDCACPQPVVASLEAGRAASVASDCACPDPATATLERGDGVDVRAQNNCACPEVVAPLVTEVAPLPVEGASVVAGPTEPSIRISVVVPQA